jgi:hypothetical protein
LDATAPFGSSSGSSDSARDGRVGWGGGGIRQRGLTTMMPERQRIFGSRRRARPLPYPVRFAVLGGGSFGLALASVLGKKSIPVTILVRKQEVADHINTHHKHPTYLSDVLLPPTIRATADAEVRGPCGVVWSIWWWSGGCGLSLEWHVNFVDGGGGGAAAAATGVESGKQESGGVADPNMGRNASSEGN